jgi:hypothetical protein
VPLRDTLTPVKRPFSGVDSLPRPSISTAAFLPAEASGMTGDSRFVAFSESFVYESSTAPCWACA